MNYISSNIRHYRTQKEFSQEYFAEELKWSRSQVASYESGRTEPSILQLIELSRYSKIPIDILIQNDLRLSKETSFIEIGNKRVLFPISVDEDNENLIEVVNVSAQAGYLGGYDDPEYIEQLEKIKLPFLPTGKHRAFPIKGDSMLPLKGGSYVVAKYLEDIRDVKNGSTYVVVTLNDGIVYKRVYCNKENMQSLSLSSDNKSYPTFEVPLNEVIELWEFTCSINTQEYDKKDLKISSIIQMFSELQVELEDLRNVNL